MSDFLDLGNLERDEVRQELIDAILDHEHNRPRTLQTHLGPSEAGVKCARRLAYSITGTKGGNVYGEVMPSMTGTALHNTMESVMALRNERLGYERYLTETKVTDPIPGTCDLYDKDRQAVLDWKFPGPTTFKKYCKYGPSPEYHEQLHLYGLGIENLGYPVKMVGDMFIPRGGKLRDAYLFYEPYDRERALGIAKRLEGIRLIAKEFDLVHHPERFKHIPASPSEDGCFFCPFWNPTPRHHRECSGVSADPDAQFN
jgi:hypothetical protein